MTSVGRLWRTSSKEFYLPGYDKFRRSERWAAPEMRVMYWPDGCICWQLNVYFLHLRRSNSAISTINTYASELSLFVRFLFESKVVIEDVCDDVLVSFSDWLVNRKKSSGNHINRILLRVISFLEWYQTLLVGRRLVGSLGQGAQVTISLRSLKSKQGVVRVRTQHHAMVPASIPRTVRPISSNIVSALLDSCEWAAKTNFRRSRDRCMLVLLADTGIRREELTWIRVSDVVGASADRKLPVRTSKRKGNPYRLIPISDETFRMLLEYIDVTRSIQVRRLNRRKIGFKDQGWLFCTREGFKMAPSTVSQLFCDLRAEAGLTERISAHMLRHRYITLQVMARLRSLSRRGSIGVEALTTVLSKIASLSGHSSLDSMWRYVDWAYEELEAEYKDSANVADEALSVIEALMGEAKSSENRALAESLLIVREAVSQLRTKSYELPSVVAHSLRSSAAQSLLPLTEN
ncbi:tyrosine-type recombinase/integrase [Pseudomonas aeruginosa]|uniref:tyrosine-type recombinase/integrase n=5 Tax=Gammaproteobacteria TaxID=1236 RepID=UPI001E65C062|nr:site-specific integrase [Pseudomonas aeruginosa]MCD2817053.1 tyrosine-type recombinase/integrase [Pseudomonas aeruginosa]MCD2833533.1 tyrosine-type recombinase/integrase [Pseudomonas aeruginosa]MCD2878262.1 tyrosine-type recombinase/integrase [Pseudomonas aeruginosa]MCD2954969.1 tyrosine-type recombinase/integrase [Pseudomonas aeruginosa]MCD2961940.1 tyrosine-type recombinase/integrase [Pseudomonas aeruginosa]